MHVSPRPGKRRASIGVGLLALCAVGISDAQTQGDDGYVLYLSEYLHGDYYYAPLGDIDVESPPLIQPTKLRLPRRFRASVELGNHDVSPDGRRIVFAARSQRNQDWDVYEATIDLARERLDNVTRITTAASSRDEDPRFSWDGAQIVYKCNGDICLHPGNYFGMANPVVGSSCELWAPSLDLSGFRVAYGKRCGAPDDDVVAYYDLIARFETVVETRSGQPDRFAYFDASGNLVFSRADGPNGESNIYVSYYGGGIAQLHDRTDSDDDPFPDRHDPNHIAFIGWQNGSYDLFVYRYASDDSVRLSEGLPLLAPVLFRQQDPLPDGGGDDTDSSGKGPPPGRGKNK